VQFKAVIHKGTGKFLSLKFYWVWEMFLTSTLKCASYLLNIKCFFRRVKSNPEADSIVSENDP